jgi:hypothetical protein
MNEGFVKYLCNSEVFFLYCIPDFGGRAGKIGSFINLPVMSLCDEYNEDAIFF